MSITDVRLGVTGTHADPDRSRCGTETTGALLDGCRSGDSGAWEQLVARYERLVYTVALRNGLSTHDAADVTQITFETLLDEIDVVQQPERLGAWLSTVARRHAWRVNRRSDVERPDDSPPISDICDDSVSWIDHIWLYEAMARLAEPCRELLMALFLDPAQPTYGEVARRMDRPLGSIGPARARCLAHLGELLGDEHER